MNSSKPSVVVAIFLAGGQFLVGQQSAGPDPHPILQRASAAMGCSLIGTDTTIAVTGTITVKGTGALMKVSIESQGNNRWRSELDTPKEHKVTIVNRGKGQMQHADGRVTPLAEHNTSHERPTHIPCLTDLALPPGLIDATYLRAELASADTLDVIEVLRKDRPGIKKLADRMKITVWLSRNTGQLIRLQHANVAENDSNDVQIVEIDYSDYRVVDGLAVAFTQKMLVDGQLSFEFTVDSARLNTPAADFTLR